MTLDYDSDLLYEYDLKKLWAVLQTLLEQEDDEGTENKEKYYLEVKQIKEGIDLKIPIWYLTNEWYDLYPSTKRVRVKGHGKISINKFMEEKEARETLIRNILLEEYDDGSNTTPRVKT